MSELTDNMSDLERAKLRKVVSSGGIVVAVVFGGDGSETPMPVEPVPGAPLPVFLGVGESQYGEATLTTSDADVTGAVLTLVPGQAYDEIGMDCSCSRRTVWNLIWNDNGTPKLRHSAVIAGDTGLSVRIFGFTAGTGTQTLKITGRSADTTIPGSVTATMRATVSARKAAA